MDCNYFHRNSILGSLKKILLIGSGKSATACIQYLEEKSVVLGFHFSIADLHPSSVQEKLKPNSTVDVLQLDVTDASALQNLLSGQFLVISLMPAQLHVVIAKACIAAGAHLLNASYLDDGIKQMENEILERGLIFISELGLDPGIDHMSAMQIIDRLKGSGAVITSFKSHCGGLVSPANDDNAWHYKISWNPKNVVHAGKAGAKFLLNADEVYIPYEKLFHFKCAVKLPAPYPELSAYPNRDSLQYISLYQLQGITTFMRTTLRYPSYMQGWKNLVHLRMTDENKLYDSGKLSLGEIIEEHLSGNNLTLALEKFLSDEEFAIQYNSLFKGCFDKILNNGIASMSDVLLYAIETNWKLKASETDMVVMQHEFEYYENEQKYSLVSSLITEGQDDIQTAMSKTVGLPLAIAACKILNGDIFTAGLFIPTHKEIYTPVLEELENCGIKFEEYISTI